MQLCKLSPSDPVSLLGYFDETLLADDECM